MGKAVVVTSQNIICVTAFQQNGFDELCMFELHFTSYV